MSAFTASIIAGLLFLSASVGHIGLNHHPKILSIISKVLLVLYTVAMFAFTLTSVTLGNQISVMFQSNGNWFTKIFNGDLTTSQTDFFINIAMMYPVGYACSSLVKSPKSIKKISASIITALVLSFSIEFLQFALPINRFPSLIDIVLNTSSGAIGSLAYIGTSKIINNFNYNLEMKRRNNNKDYQLDKVQTVFLSKNQNLENENKQNKDEISILKNEKKELEQEIKNLNKIKDKNNNLENDKSEKQAS